MRNSDKSSGVGADDNRASVGAKARHRRRRTLTALISAGAVSALTLTLGGFFGDVGGRVSGLVFEGETPTPSPTLEVQRLPSGTLRPTVNVGVGVITPRDLTEIPRPPARNGGTTPPYDSRFKEWLQEVDGVHAESTAIDFLAAYEGPGPVIIRDIRAVVVDRSGPLSGTLVRPVGGDGLDAKLLVFNLDGRQPKIEVQENPVTGEKWQFPLRVSQGNDEFFQVIGRTLEDEVTWYVEVDYVLDGELATARVDDDGEPFRTSATSAVTDESYFPESADPWPFAG
jgi:hypothetical protein